MASHFHGKGLVGASVIREPSGFGVRQAGIESYYMVHVGVEVAPGRQNCLPVMPIITADGEKANRTAISVRTELCFRRPTTSVEVLDYIALESPYHTCDR